MGIRKIEVPKNVLCINFGWSSYSHKSIKDSGLRLEQQIDKVVDYIVDDLNEKIEDRKQSEIRQREYDRKKHIREFNERIAQDRKKQLEHALKESKDLESLIRMKLYLKTMKEIFAKLPEEEQAAGMAWISLVKQELRTIQPVETRIKKSNAQQKKPRKRTKIFGTLICCLKITILILRKSTPKSLKITLTFKNIINCTYIN